MFKLKQNEKMKKFKLKTNLKNVKVLNEQKIKDNQL